MKKSFLHISAFLLFTAGMMAQTSNEGMFYIHYKLKGQKKMKNVFTYDWRLWMAPELRDLLLEAGFSKVHAYWEKTNAEGEGTGVFYEPDYVENQEIWWTYLAAER